MAENKIKPKPEPTGSRLVRLRDLDESVVREAARRCAQAESDERMAWRFLELAIDPGDASGRVAA